MTEFLISAAYPVALLAVTVLAFRVGYLLLRRWALSEVGASEPLQLVDADAPPARPRSVDWTELGLVAFVLLNGGVALASSGPLVFLGLLGVCVGSFSLYSRDRRSPLVVGGPHG